MIITHLTLKTSDIKGAEDFYAGLLNLPVIKKTKSTISFQAGLTVLEFLEVPYKCFYHFAFNISSCSFDPIFAWIKSRTGILPFSTTSCVADYPGWNAKAFYFHDHEENIVECITRFDLPVPPNGEINETVPFMSISEIGIVVEDVEPVLHQVREFYGVPLFSKGPQLPDFTPMGDDEGLFLITKKCRGWWPTYRPSEQHDLQISFLQNNKSANLLMESGKILVLKTT